MLMPHWALISEDKKKSVKEGSPSCAKCYKENEQLTVKEKSQQWERTLAGRQRGLSDEVAPNWPLKDEKELEWGKGPPCRVNSNRKGPGEVERSMPCCSNRQETSTAGHDGAQEGRIWDEREVWEGLVGHKRNRTIFWSEKLLKVLERWKYWIWFTFVTVSKFAFWRMAGRKARADIGGQIRGVTDPAGHVAETRMILAGKEVLNCFMIYCEFEMIELADRLDGKKLRPLKNTLPGHYFPMKYFLCTTEQSTKVQSHIT